MLRRHEHTRGDGRQTATDDERRCVCQLMNEWQRTSVVLGGPARSSKRAEGHRPGLRIESLALHQPKRRKRIFSRLNPREPSIRDVPEGVYGIH